MTNDGATILKLLEVEHPAAKVLVELAELQDQEVGDGTTSVVRDCVSLADRAKNLRDLEEIIIYWPLILGLWRFVFYLFPSQTNPLFVR